MLQSLEAEDDLERARPKEEGKVFIDAITAEWSDILEMLGGALCGEVSR